MTKFCALTPIPGGAIGRGFGRGYNRARTATNQLHAGQDFIASSGSPVYAPLPGRVVFVAANEGTNISAAQAAGGAVGRVRGMGGYGNAVVLQHDFQLPAPGTLPSGQNPPALPATFWTSYNHLSTIGVRAGDTVQIGQQLGTVGNTTNGQFAGMGAHLHFEVRKRAFPGNYNADTVDPNVLWYSLGFGNPGARLEVQRTVGGSILPRVGGPSDCAPGQSTELRGLLGAFGDVPPGFVDLKDRYPAATSTAPATEVEPPDYAPSVEAGVALPRPQNCPGGWQVLLPGVPCVSTGQAAGAGAAVALLLGMGAWAVLRQR